MKCNNCGTNLGESDVFCSNCGTPVQRVNNASNGAENEYSYERNINNNQQQQHQQQQQYQYQQQQQYQQNYGQANNYRQPYKKSKNTEDIIKICVGTFIGVVIFIAIVFVIYSVLFSLNKNKNNNVNTKNPSSSLTTDNNSGVTPVSNDKSSSYKVNYAGFKLYIPDNLVYEMDYENDAIVIGNSEQTWMAQFLIKQASFQQMKKNKNQLSSLLTQEFTGYNAKVSNAVIENIGGVEYILLECETGGTKMIIGYAGLNSMYSVAFTLMNEDNDFDRNLLKELSKIISSAEYTGDSAYMKSNNSIKLTDLNKAFDKAMEIKDGE